MTITQPGYYWARLYEEWAFNTTPHWSVPSERWQIIQVTDETEYGEKEPGKLWFFVMCDDCAHELDEIHESDGPIVRRGETNERSYLCAPSPDIDIMSQRDTRGTKGVQYDITAS